jgi:hypothetical protein
MARVDIGDLKNINSTEKLMDIFTSKLNYAYEDSLLTTSAGKKMLLLHLFMVAIDCLGNYHDRFK